MNIKKGDNVVVIAGKDKGKTGKVTFAFPADSKVVVDGVNTQKKHLKARSAQDVGGIIDKNGPIDVSNVMILCPTCNKGTRIGHVIDEKGNKVRVCKKCGAVLPEASAPKKEAEKKPAKAKRTKKTKEEKAE